MGNVLFLLEANSLALSKVIQGRCRYKAADSQKLHPQLCPPAWASAGS